MPWGKEDPKWRQVVNPATGQGFGTWEDYNSWSMGQEAGAKTAGADAGAASTRADTSANMDRLGGYNWGAGGAYKTGDNGQIYFGASTSGSGAVIDPKTGEIRYITPGQTPNFNAFSGPYGDESVDWTTAKYDPTYDYGLGSQYGGVIPVGYDATGTPNAFYAPTWGGGGQVFSTPDDAQRSLASYTEWARGQGKLPPATSSPVATTMPTGPGYTEPGKLAQPLQGEQFYDSTKGFYTQPTEAHKVWDQTKNQPIAAQQHWEGIAGKFKGPSYAENLYGNYADIFSDPNALQGIYDREQDRTQRALDARAAAGGYGDSSAAVRATGNLGLAFADRRLGAMQGFAKTGMDLASSADTGRNNQALVGGTLATQSDRGVNDRINTASLVDTGDVQRILAGQNASGAAQGLTVGRETGALTSGMGLAGAQAALTKAGFDQATGQKFMGELGAIAIELQAGNLDYNAAMQKAQETAALMGVASSTALNTLIAAQLMGGSGLYGPTSPGLSNVDPFETM